MLRIAAAVNAAERDLYCRQCSQSCSNEPWFAKVLLVGRVSEAAPGVRCVLQSGNDNRPVHDLKCVVCMRVNLLVEKLIGLWMTRLLEAWGWLGRCTGLIQNWSVMEIGRNSACSLGAGVLGTGVIVARFHCCRVVELARDRLKQFMEYRSSQSEKPYHTFWSQNAILMACFSRVENCF